MQTALAGMHSVPKTSLTLFRDLMSRANASSIPASERAAMQRDLSVLQARVTSWRIVTNKVAGQTFIDVATRMLRELATRAIAVGRGKPRAQRSRFLKSRK